MASTKQVTAAKRNIKKAASAAKRKRTITKLPKAVRQDLGRNAAAARKRGGKPGHWLEDRTRASSTKRRRSETSRVARRWANVS